MNCKSTFAVLAAGLFLFGCSPKEEAPSSTSSSGNPLTAPADYVGAAGQAKKRVERGLSTAGLQQAIQMFQAQEGRFPKTLEELVSKQYLDKLPPAPAGQKYQYNATTGDLRVVAAQ